MAVRSEERVLRKVTYLERGDHSLMTLSNSLCWARMGNSISHAQGTIQIMGAIHI